MKTSIIFFILTLLSSACLASEEFFSLANCKSKDCSNALELPLDFEITDQEGDYLSDKEELEVKAELSPVINELGDFAFGLTSTLVISEAFTERDKKQHFQAGAIVGYFSGKACEYGFTPFKIERSNRSRFFCAMAGALVAGVAKELYDMTDQENHTVDGADAFATALGGVTSINFFEIQF